MYKKENHILKPDIVLKRYWEDNARFADLFNQAFFQGRQVLQPEKFCEQDSELSEMLPGSSGAISLLRRRDIIKRHTDEAALVLIGLENQMKVHYAMPVRTMVYDALSYTRQCRQTAQKRKGAGKWGNSKEFLSGIGRQDKILPTLTLVLYYGETPWDGPRCLKDMMELPEYLEPYFNDYPLHLLTARDAGLLHFRHPDNEDLFTLIRALYETQGKADIEKLRGQYPKEEISWETLAALGAAVASPELISLAGKYEGGNIHMCTALENLKMEGRLEGRLEGRAEGEQRVKAMKALLLKLLSEGRTEEIELALKDDNKLKALFHEYEADLTKSI